LPVNGERLLWRQVEDGVERRLRGNADAARELDVGFGAGDGQIGLQDFEPRRGAGFEPRLCGVTHAPRDVEQALGEPGALVGGEQTVEILPQVSPHRTKLGLNVDLGERQLLLGEIDAARPLAAELHGQIEIERLMRRVLGGFEADVRVRQLPRGADRGLADRACAASRLDVQVARGGQR
jgi:hypothetical protein